MHTHKHHIYILVFLFTCISGIASFFNLRRGGKGSKCQDGIRGTTGCGVEDSITPGKVPYQGFADLEAYLMSRTPITGTPTILSLVYCFSPPLPPWYSKPSLPGTPNLVQFAVIGLQVFRAYISYVASAPMVLRSHHPQHSVLILYSVFNHGTPCSSW